MFCNIFSNAGTQTEDITTMRPLSVMSGGEQSTPYKASGSHVTVSSSPGNKVIITFESLVYLNYFIYYVFFVKSVCSDALNTNYIWYEIKIKSTRIRRVTARQFAIVFQVCEVLSHIPHLICIFCLQNFHKLCIHNLYFDADSINQKILQAWMQH
jgi:hypothetical protein